MSVIADRMARLMSARELSQSELARRVGVKQQAIQAIVAGKTLRPRNLREIARELQTTEAYLLGEANEPTTGDEELDSPLEVPLVGYVAAGAAVRTYDAETQGPLEMVLAPEGSNERTVAVEVRGDSLGPLFNHWLAFYDQREEPVTENLIGRLCIVGLEDGRVLVKYLKRSRTKGLYHLISNVGDPISDVPVRWAAKVKHLTPRL